MKPTGPRKLVCQRLVSQRYLEFTLDHASENRIWSDLSQEVWDHAASHGYRLTGDCWMTRVVESQFEGVSFRITALVEPVDGPRTEGTLEELLLEMTTCL